MYLIIRDGIIAQGEWDSKDSACLCATMFNVINGEEVQVVDENYKIIYKLP